MSVERSDELDELLFQLRMVQQRDAWRRQVLADAPQITLGAMRTLRVVERGTGVGSEVSVRDVADELGVEHSTASRAVQAMVEQGLLAKAPAESDQRRCRLGLTESGQRVLTDAVRRRRALVNESVKGWQASDVDTLVALLDRLVGAMTRAVE